MPDVFTFIGVENVTPALNKIKSGLGEVDKKTKNFTDRLTTLNTRTIATRVGVTALAFSIVRLGASADETILKLKNLDDALANNARRVDELEQIYISFKIELQKLFVTEMGKWIQIWTTFAGAIQGLSEEQIRAKLTAFALKNELQDTTGVITKQFDATTKLVTGYKDLITELERKNALSKETNDIDKQILEISFIIQDQVKLWEKAVKDGTLSGEAFIEMKKRLKQITDELIKSIRDEAKTVKEVTDITGRRFFESGRGERVAIKSDFKLNPTTGKYEVSSTS